MNKKKQRQRKARKIKRRNKTRKKAKEIYFRRKESNEGRNQTKEGIK